MDFDRQRLQDDLLGLADLPSAPADPAPEVRRRVRRIRRRRAAGVALLAASAVVAVTTLTGPTLGALRGDGAEPGFVGTPSVTPTSRGTPLPTSTPSPGDPPPTNTTAIATPTFPLPEPWSDRKHHDVPEHYRPAYVISEGTIAGRKWFAVSHRAPGQDGGTSCVSTAPHGTVFEPFYCFAYWPEGKRANWYTSRATIGAKTDPNQPEATLVLGATSTDARTVQVLLSNGRTYTTDAVGTPTSHRLRYFAVVVPVKDAKVDDVRPLDANGELADPPPPVAEMPKWSDTKATGPGYEEYVPGRRGRAYIVGEGDGAIVVSHPKDGHDTTESAQVCLAGEPNQNYADAQLCEGDTRGLPTEDEPLWRAFPGQDGTTLVMGIMVFNQKTKAELLDEDGNVIGAVSAVATPHRSWMYFMTVLSAQAPEVATVRQVSAGGK